MICVSQLTALSDNVFCIQISYAYSPFTFWLKIGKSPVFQCITVTDGIPGHAYSTPLFPYVELICAHW